METVIDLLKFLNMKKFQILACAFVALLTVLTVKAQEKTTDNTILTAYFDVKNALANDDAAATNTKADVLLKAINNFKTDQLSATDKTVWAKYAEKLKFDTRHIAENKEIAHQREHFNTLSQNLYEAVKALKLNTTTVYRQYCPMKKSYWLSETSAIKNPFYGSQMLTCGSVKEALAP